MADVWVDRNRADELIGRDDDLEALVNLVPSDGPHEGKAALLLAGDAGVGKTRLVQEFLARMRHRGTRTLVGHCLDFGDTAMPYLPFADVLRRFAQDEPQLAADHAARHPELSQLTGKAAAAGAEHDRTSESLGRAEVFAGFRAWVDEVAATEPVVLVIEDLHWADPSSRDLLSFLLTRGFDNRVTVVATYRSDDLHRRHPLRPALAEWARIPGIERVTLGPLAAPDVRRLIADITGDTGTDRYRTDFDRIVERAEGNAFYVEELVAAFLTGGWSLPEDLADLLLVRLDRLDDEARTLVREASVGGQRVPHELLSAVSSLEGRALDQAIRQAIDTHILVLVGTDSYAFRHALLGEAVYDDLLPGERIDLHRAYAAAITAQDADGSPAALAKHAFAAQDYEAGLVASIAAGRRAMSVGGPDEAARHFEKALSVYDRASANLTDPPPVAELVKWASEAIAAAGMPARAHRMVMDHLEQVPSDSPHRAPLLVAAAESALLTDPDIDPRELTTEALELIGPEHTVLRAHALAAHSLALLWMSPTPVVRGYADEALEIANELDLPRLAISVGMTLARTIQHLDFGETARIELERLMQRARAEGDVNGEIRSHFRLGMLYQHYADLEHAQTCFAEAANVAARSGSPWTPYGVDGRMRAALCAYARGQWEEALGIIDMSAENPPATSRAMLRCVAVLVAAGRGDQRALDESDWIREHAVQEGYVEVLLSAAAIDVLGRTDVAAARAAYDAAVASLAQVWGPAFGARVRLGALLLGAMADTAVSAPAAERDELLAAGEQILADCEVVVPTAAADGEPWGVEGQAWLVRARAEYQRLRWACGATESRDELLELWRDATFLFADAAEHYEMARAQARLAQLLLAIGESEDERAEGRKMAAEARTIADDLRARALQRDLDGLVATRATQLDPVTLTRREREILVLVAAGRSNGEIGKQLYIATKTVSVHVSNILAKLGAASRTEAAAIARRDGLVN